MTDFLNIDGSMGEGGGQILRTALSLSMVTGKPVHLTKIRQGREKPGLMRQHLTGVRAAKEVCGAKVDGDNIGSTELTFSPGRVQAGTYDFAVGTAGSATLVLQTILPVLLLANDQSTATVEGGTHTPNAPTFDFIDRCYIPAINAMGPTVKVELGSYGFLPVGGGSLKATVTPTKQLSRVDFMKRDPQPKIEVRSCIALLSHDICQREIKALKSRLDLSDEDCRVETDLKAPCCGNYVHAEVQSEGCPPACFTGFGKKGVSAEHVADRVAKEVKVFIETGAVIEKRLADQLLLPMAMAGTGSFRTARPSNHTLTNIEIIKKFLDVSIQVSQETEKVWLVEIG